LAEKPCIHSEFLNNNEFWSAKSTDLSEKRIRKIKNKKRQHGKLTAGKRPGKEDQSEFHFIRFV